MWISKKKLKEIEDRAYDRGLDLGYRLGFSMGQAEARNRMFGEPKSLIDLQVEDILRREEEG